MPREIVPAEPEEVRGHDVRWHPDFNSTPITPETYRRLLVGLEAVYPGKWRRAVDVCPVAVNKTIDNEADALATLAKIELAGKIPPAAAEITEELVAAAPKLANALVLMLQHYTGGRINNEATAAARDALQAAGLQIVGFEL